MKLNELAVGKSAAILRVGGKGALRQHFLDMGMIPGAEVTVIKLAPMPNRSKLSLYKRSRADTRIQKESRRRSTPDWVRTVNITQRRRKIRCPTAQN